jgi:thioredoxin-like negative regulator of GroEL
MATEMLVLTEFYARSCVPCKLVAPIVDQVGKEFKGRLTVRKVDVQQEPGIAVKYAIMSVPTVVLENGHILWVGKGLRQAHEIRGEVARRVAS